VREPGETPARPGAHSRRDCGLFWHPTRDQSSSKETICSIGRDTCTPSYLIRLWQSWKFRKHRDHRARRSRQDHSGGQDCSGRRGAFRENQVVMERVMDSNPLERERRHHDPGRRTLPSGGRGRRSNIVDTPGHADFGGEVERILRMVDGVLLVVDAFDGPMPQTRFVLRKALALHRTPIVVINKIDRARLGSDARPRRGSRSADRARGERGAAQREPSSTHRRRRRCRDDGHGCHTPVDLSPLFDAIIEHVPAPAA